jgi:hypothetical protein
MAYLSGGSPVHDYIIEYDYANEFARVLDVTNGIANADSIAVTPVLGTAANLNGTGDIALKNNADSTVTIFVLGTNNGIGAYKFQAHIPTGIFAGTSGVVPTSFSLSQNYPNPFNPTTLIAYSIPKNTFVTLKVYNVLGQEVATLFAGNQKAGNYVATFDGSKCASGIYLYRLQAGSVSITKKMVLVK